MLDQNLNHWDELLGARRSNARAYFARSRIAFSSSRIHFEADFFRRVDFVERVGEPCRLQIHDREVAVCFT